MNKKSLIAVLLLASSLPACTRRLMDFTVISSHNVDLSNAGKFRRGATRSEGIDRTHWILFIPTGVPDMKEAVDNAIKRIPGAVALVDGVIYETGWSILLYGQTVITVEGTPIIDPSLLKSGEAEAPRSNYVAAYQDPVSHQDKLLYLSQADFERLSTALRAGDASTVAAILPLN